MMSGGKFINSEMCMKFVADYKIIVENSDGISNQVNIYMNAGWQPYGSPFALGGLICQAIVKYTS